jgi:PTS system nitrogen regulatory IIA component
MKLTVREAARVLAVPESQIYRWVESGELPCTVMNHQPLFNRPELLDWATVRRLPVARELFETEEDDPARTPHLTDALTRGGIHRDVPGADLPAVLRALMQRLPLPEDTDREALLEVLLAREAVGSTAIGDGIAIPHVRSPLVFPGTPAAAVLCFLAQPISFPAGPVVQTLFVLVSATIRAHLQLLARLSVALLDPGFKAAVLRRAATDELLAEARRIESTPTGQSG